MINDVPHSLPRLIALLSLALSACAGGSRLAVDGPPGLPLADGGGGGENGSDAGPALPPGDGRWQVVESGTTVSLQAVWGSSASDVWAVGDKGTILRFDGSLYFANAHDFQTAVRRAIAAAEPAPQVVLLDGEALNGVDATAVITLREFQQQLQGEAIEMRFARIKTHVLEVMQHGGLEETIPPQHFYPSVQAGVDAYLAEQQEK